MKKNFTIVLFLFFHSYFCTAQQPSNDDDQKVEVVKMAYMTRELNLTPQEAQNFWPVYNNYNGEIRQARSQYPNDEVAFEKKVVEIKQRYQGNFKKVLGGNGQRLNKVYTTDRQFKDLLRNEVQQRQHQKQQQQPSSQQRQIQPPANKGNKNPNANGQKINKPVKIKERKQHQR